MVIYIQNSFLAFFLLFSISYTIAESNDEYLPMVQQYQLAYNNSNFSDLQPYTFSQKEYDELLSRVQNRNPDCVTSIETDFDINVFKQAFEKSHLYRLKSDTIVIDNIQDLQNCSNQDAKRINCFIYFMQEHLSVPISLIVINFDNKKKIILDIVNENHFKDAKL